MAVGEVADELEAASGLGLCHYGRVDTFININEKKKKRKNGKWRWGTMNDKDTPVDPSDLQWVCIVSKSNLGPREHQ